MHTQKPYYIILGNQKGGTGKSTISLHIIVELLRLGYKVASIDVDASQGTITRYIENRQQYSDKHNIQLPMPNHHPIEKTTDGKDIAQFDALVPTLSDYDFVVIDTPGHDNPLSQHVHSFADTLITPINDSFIDLDVVVRVKDLSKKEISPSTYSEMVWNQKKQRLVRDKVTIDWIIVRNRLSSITARNKKEMWEILQALSNRLGFRVAAGLGERVIFRELFLSGLTLLDLHDIGEPLTLSHVAARQELRSLMQMIQLPHLENRLKDVG